MEEKITSEGMTQESVSRPIGKDQVREAEQILQKYKQGKASLEKRIIENEQWFKLRHWDEIRSKDSSPYDPEPASAWLFNSIANKHADAMDNYPEPTVLPREAGDKQDAKLLSEILPVVLEQCEFERTYSDLWWYKLKTGTGVYGVFWDPSKNNGIGDIEIQDLDLLNLFWEPGVIDIQESRNVFHIALVDSDILQEKYPELADSFKTPTVDIASYVHDDTIDTSDKSVVVDWYYKKSDGGRKVLHYCKFCNGEVLYASENDPEYASRGFYDHGKYPFIFDVLFPIAGTPVGFGYLDVCKSPQLYIDKLDQVILQHAVMGARPRFWVKGDGKVNEEEFSDWKKSFVHFYGSGDPNASIMPIEIPTISGAYVDVRSLKIDELKETSGNRDFSQGGTASGVTAASAIAALQEAGSKLSRDMIKASYRQFAQVGYLCIELMRQFYQESRYFRIIGEMGTMEFVQFSGRQIASKPQGSDFGMDMGYRMPVFDIVVGSQKSSPFSTAAQNERAKELYSMGFFRADLADQSLAALEMMDFEGIDTVRQRISQNATLYKQVQQLQQQVVELSALIDTMRPGSGATQMAMESVQNQTAQESEGNAPGGNSKGFIVNSLGNMITAGKARAKVAEASTPN